MEKAAFEACAAPPGHCVKLPQPQRMAIQFHRLEAKYWVRAQSWVGARDHASGCRFSRCCGESKVLPKVFRWWTSSFSYPNCGLALPVTKSCRAVQMFLSIVFQLPRPELDGTTQRDESSGRHQLLRLPRCATIHQEREFVRYHFQCGYHRSGGRRAGLLGAI